MLSLTKQRSKCRCESIRRKLHIAIPSETVTDKGKEFVSNIFLESCKLLGIKNLNSTAYHHETLGALENSRKHLGAYLRTQVEKYCGSWSSWVPYWSFAYNTTVHTETKYTPFELVFGKICRLPSNLENDLEPLYNFDDYPKELKYRLQHARNDARSNLLQSKQNRKEKFDKKCRDKTYKVGDRVLVTNEARTNKLEALFKGPYDIVEDKDPNVVINVGNKQVEVHKNRVKLYTGNKV
jgi:hypothetical protein